MDLNDLAKAAKEEGIDVTASPSSRTELTEDETYIVQPELARDKGENEKGTRTFSVMFRVLDGPDNVNRVYWDNFYISPKDTAKGFNARAFHYLETVGLPVDVLSAANGDEGILTAAASQVKVNVTAGYDEKGDMKFNRHHYEALATATVTVTEEEGDADVDFDF